MFAYATPSLSSIRYVNNGDPLPVATLLSSFSASQTYVGWYAVVSDLWGSVQEVMRCSYDGNTYYWRPQRTDYAVASTQTSGAMSLVPLVSAPIIALQSTLLGNMTVTPTTTNVWPGCTFTIQAPSGLGIFSLSVSGLVGGLVGTLLGGSTRTITYTASGWK